MKIAVTVVPRARTTRVEPLADGGLRVRVAAPPHAGQANAAVIEALAAHYRVPKSRVRIVSGGAGRRKLVEIAVP